MIRQKRQLITATVYRMAGRIHCPSTGVIEHDLPALLSLPPQQRKDAVVFLCFALLRALQVEAAGHDGELRFAARPGKHTHLDMLERERAHLFAGGVVLLVTLQDLFVAFANTLPNEGCLRRLLVSLHELLDVPAVPCLGL